VARKKHHAEHENHERWLVSYADFITLLFAFFVVMFASSQTDKAKAKQLSDSVKQALENGGVAAQVHEILGGTVEDKGRGNAMMKGPGGANKPEKPPEIQLAELLPSLKILTKTLAADIDSGKIDVHLEPRGLVVSLRQATFFPSGADNIDESTYATIQRIAETIGNLPNLVRLEGHTDAIPIHTARFRSNWELSASRAIAMMDLLSERFKVPRGRMAIAGYADTAPLASNDTEEGRARNRRVDVVILNQQTAIKNEPAGTQHGATAGAPPSAAAPAPPAGKPAEAHK
jgi:chemotaxis protein MotB